MFGQRTGFAVWLALLIGIRFKLNFLGFEFTAERFSWKIKGPLLTCELRLPKFVLLITPSNSQSRIEHG